MEPVGAAVGAVLVAFPRSDDVPGLGARVLDGRTVDDDCAEESLLG